MSPRCPHFRSIPLQFVFEPTGAADRYDTWKHYVAVRNRPGFQKAVDIVAIEPAQSPVTTWLHCFRVVSRPVCCRG
jgi:hypothetical protein